MAIVTPFNLTEPFSTDTFNSRISAINTNILKNATKELYGLDEASGPDDAFAWIGKYNQYWWSALHDQGGIAYNEVKTTISSPVRITKPEGAPSQTISYSKQISINQNTGVIVLENPQQLTVDGSYSAAATTKTSLENLCAMAPVYITNLYTDTAAVYYLPQGSVFIIDTTDTTIARYGTGDGYHYALESDGNATKAQLVTSKMINIPPGEKLYLYSIDRNAYPDSGEVDGVLYEYLGVPFEKFPAMPQIATGSYTGTGTYGSSNPNSITFDFRPKFLALFDDSGFLVQLGSPSNRAIASLMNLTESYQNNVLWSWQYNNNYTNAKFDSATKALYWYHVEGANYQLNSSGVVYYYIAIG